MSALAIATLFGTALSPANAREPVSLDFFYDNLEPYGNWREIGDYGYCWQPRDVPSDWSPYSDGRWVYTDAGWTWDSPEPYGWAVYHYGRWANIDQVGWIWVPGTEWGPGWVSWRHSSRYVGWAPLPPEALFLQAIGFYGWVDDYYNIGPSSYRFVEGRNFGSRRLNTVFIDQRQNISIINETTNITNITYQNNVIHNGGLRYDQQSRQSSEPIPRYRLDRRQSFDGDPHRQPIENLRPRVEGDAFSVLALPFVGSATTKPRTTSERLDRAEVNRGWNGLGSTQEIAEMRARMKSKIRVPEELPPQPRYQRPSERPGPPEGSTRQPTERGKDGKSKPGASPSVQDQPPQRMTPPSTQPGSSRPDPSARPGRPETRPSPGGKPDGKGRMTDPRDPRSDAKPGSPPTRPQAPEKKPQPGAPPSAKPGASRPDQDNKPGRPEARPSNKPDSDGKGKRPDEGRPERSSEKPSMKAPERQLPPSRAPEARPSSKPKSDGKGKRPDEGRSERSNEKPSMKAPERQLPPSQAPQQRTESKRKPEERKSSPGPSSQDRGKMNERKPSPAPQTSPAPGSPQRKAGSSKGKGKPEEQDDKKRDKDEKKPK